MHRKTAVVLGATGLIGKHLVQELLENEFFSKVKILVRKPISLNHPKADVQVVNFNDEKDIAAKIDIGDVIFCSISYHAKSKAIRSNTARSTTIFPS